MSIYAISDLHLSFNTNKPMDIFGWENYEERIKTNWLEKVNEKDLVLLPGDFSWEMKLENTYKDFEFINNLPGKKLLLKGNHDLWWTTLKKMRTFLEEENLKNIDFIYNNSFLIEDKILIGTRGWNLLETENSEKMINRENNRLKLSIEDGINRYGKDKEIIAFMHYPPITLNNINSELVKTLQKYNIKKCYYGHLHGNSIKDAVEGKYFGIEFKLVSCDGLDFKLLKIQ